MQTIWPAVFSRRTHGPAPVFRRERWTTPDADFIDVDFLAGGVLKYLLASAGLAYLYVRQELLTDALKPTAMGWFSQANIFAMDIYANTPHPTARRFESGTPPVPNTYAAVAGIKLVQSVGVANIERQLKVLTGALKEGIMKRGFNLMSPVDPTKHDAMITVRSHKVDLLTKWLANDGIIVSHRDDNLRISPHFYNDLHDVDCVIDGLSKYHELLV